LVATIAVRFGAIVDCAGICELPTIKHKQRA